MRLRSPCLLCKLVYLKLEKYLPPLGRETAIVYLTIELALSKNTCKVGLNKLPDVKLPSKLNETSEVDSKSATI